MIAYELAGVIVGAVALIGTFGTLMTWVYKRGRIEGNFEKSLQDNTRSNEQLTSVVSGLSNSLHVGFKEVHDRIDTHDVALAQHNISLAVHDRDILRLQKAVE